MEIDTPDNVPMKDIPQKIVKLPQKIEETTFAPFAAKLQQFIASNEQSSILPAWRALLNSYCTTVCIL